MPNPVSKSDARRMPGLQRRIQTIDDLKILNSQAFSYALSHGYLAVPAKD
jgi:hypothetical protein